ncbi:MAG: SRPBCC domain-containing protein [Rhizomicrobium sp.]
MKNRTTVERTSEREVVTTRTFNGPARIVFAAWTRPELLKQWWAPTSLGGDLHFLRGRCSYGRHLPLRVRPPRLGTAHGVLRQVSRSDTARRLVWTNEEGGEGRAVTTVTFEERGAETLVVMRDLYPRRKLSTKPSPPGAWVGTTRRSRNWTIFSSRWARAWDGRNVVDFAVGRDGFRGPSTGRFAVPGP